VQQGNGKDEPPVEPVRHVDVTDLALGDGAEENDRVGNPDHGDQDVDRPLEFGVFLSRGDTQRQGDGGQDDDQLPAPEREGRQAVGEDPCVAGALDNIVRGGEQGAATEGKYHRVRVQGTQTPEMQPAQIQLWPDQLGGDDHADQHSDNPPDDGHHGKLPHHLVVVC
jgi:hypothetical protein